MNHQSTVRSSCPMCRSGNIPYKGNIVVEDIIQSMATVPSLTTIIDAMATADDMKRLVAETAVKDRKIAEKNGEIARLNTELKKKNKEIRDINRKFHEAFDVSIVLSVVLFCVTLRWWLG